MERLSTDPSMANIARTEVGPGLGVLHRNIAIESEFWDSPRPPQARRRLPEELSLPCGVTGPLERLPLMREASICLGVPMMPTVWRGTRQSRAVLGGRSHSR